MRTSSSLLVFVGPAACLLAACPPCPVPGASTATVTDVGGVIESEGTSEPHTYQVTTTYVNGEECRVFPESRDVEESDVESQVRAELTLDCQTSLVPRLVVRLPDLRSTEESPEPVTALADITLEPNFGGNCTVRLVDVPIELTILAAEGSGAGAPTLVTPGFRREALVSVGVDPGAQPGTRPDGSSCVVDAPPLTLDLDVTMTDVDYGRPGGGCG